MLSLLVKIGIYGLCEIMCLNMVTLIGNKDGNGVKKPVVLRTVDVALQAASLFTGSRLPTALILACGLRCVDRFRA